jgi:hypothetical protein
MARRNPPALAVGRFNRIKWAWQRAYRGYDDTAFWDLQFYLATIAAPTLRKMSQSSGRPPLLTQEEWESHLSNMAIAMELIVMDKITYTKEQVKAIDRGIALFGKWYKDLWT